MENEICILEQIVGKIVKIAGERTYVVPAVKLYSSDCYSVNDLQKTVNAVNIYLQENPNFIPSIFEQVEKRQKVKK